MLVVKLLVLERNRYGLHVRADYVDRLVSAWRQRDPELDVSSLEVAGRLLRAAIHVERAREAALLPHGLSLGDYDVLATLRRMSGDSGVNPKDLSGSALITSGAMTSRLDRLESAGLVERRPDPSDRRGVQVHLTAAGRRTADRALADVLAAHEELLAPLTPRERDTAAGALRKILLGRGDT